MATFKVKEINYQSRRMDAFDQMIVAKRLMPVLKHVVTPDVIRAAFAVVQAKEPGKDAVATVESSGMAKMLPAIADALYAVSDEDLKIIVTKCLALVDRQNTGGAFSPLLAPTGALLFQALTMPEMVQICFHVIQEHLGDFFSIAP